MYLDIRRRVILFFLTLGAPEPYTATDLGGVVVFHRRRNTGDLL